MEKVNTGETSYKELNEKILLLRKKLKRSTRQREGLELAKEQNRSLFKAINKEVEEAKRTIQDLLDNTGQGFLSFGSDFKISPEYSKACLDFFGHDIASSNVLELLFKENKNSIQENFQLMFDGMGSLNLFIELLPKELKVQNKILQLDFRDIKLEGKLARIMIILTDVTRERALQEILAKDEEHKQKLVKIAVDKEGFTQFVLEIWKVLEKVKSQLNQKISQINVNKLFRYYHTIKGGSASYALNQLAHQAHEIESRLAQIRESNLEISNDLVKVLQKSSLELEANFNNELEQLSDFISLEEIKQSKQAVYKIDETKVKKLEQTVSKLDLTIAPEITNAINSLRLQPIKPFLKRLAGEAENLAKKLGKDIKVSISGCEIEINYQKFNSLFTVLVHLIRNSVDHGIESPDIRTMLGKNPTGNILIKAALKDNYLSLIFQDDGAGINFERIKKIALNKKVITQAEFNSISNSETLKLIFTPGFSSNETVTEISGRGVGMDAIKMAVKERGGILKIKTKLDQGSKFEVLVKI